MQDYSRRLAQGINTLLKTQMRELYTLFNRFTPKSKKHILLMFLKIK